MKPNYYRETATKQENAEKIKQMILRESRDLSAIIKANSGYLSENELREVKEESMKIIFGDGGIK